MDRTDFDTQAFFAALDAQRKAKGLSWRQVQKETGVSASTLVRIDQDKLPDVKNFVAIIMWLGLPLETFWKGEEKQPVETLAAVSALLHNDPGLSNEDAKRIDNLVQSIYLQLRK